MLFSLKYIIYLSVASVGLSALPFFLLSVSSAADDDTRRFFLSRLFFLVLLSSGSLSELELLDDDDDDVEPELVVDEVLPESELELVELLDGVRFFFFPAEHTDNTTNSTNTHTETTVLRPFFQHHPSEPVQ